MQSIKVVFAYPDIWIIGIVEIVEFLYSFYSVKDALDLGFWVEVWVLVV